MSVVRVTRTVPADPASVALLVSGPSALDLWPGVRAVDTGPGPQRAAVPADGSSRRAYVVAARPPFRTPTAYVSQFILSTDGLPAVDGVARVSGAAWRGGTPQALVTLEARVPAGDGQVEGELRRVLESFLDNLADSLTGALVEAGGRPAEAVA